jgi:asparagine synthase (glutamine-hydrolysing)
MCGIAGILNLTEAAPPEEQTLRAMLGMIRHRGPDQFGVYLADQIGLGNARLSILDLTSGQQPISNEDETLWIVFNGEIFNYLELRAELEARGHRFTTATDTEVLLHLYEEKGPECLQRLNGQWAVAIWNERDRTLFLARDRLGVRPLFYTRCNGRLIFGSEIKAIFACPEVPRDLDPVALDQVFTYWSVQTPRTSFKGVFEIPPGHYLLVRDGDMKLRRYWHLEFSPEVPPSANRLPRSEEEYAEEFRALLVDAVRIRLRADVPVGAYLSGGLDSSTIAAVVRELGVSHLDTFSIAFDNPEFDESAYQRRMARFLGTDHQVVTVTHAAIARVFPDVIWHTETPILRTAPAPMFLLSQLVHDRGYKVVLTGEGADEFLGGYDIFKETMVRRFWARQPLSEWRPALLRRLYPEIGGLAAASDAYLRAFFGHGLTETDRPDYSHMLRWRTTSRAKRFFSRELLDAIAAELGHPPPVVGEATDHRFPTSDFRLLTSDLRVPSGSLERAQYLEITTFLSPYLLSSQGDRVAMAHSVEGRFPFLDYRVAEFCNRLPPKLKLRGLRDKRLLRRTAQRWLPAEVQQRRKRPYRAPIHRSFFGDSAPAYVGELTSVSAMARSGWFQSRAIDQLIRKANEGQRMSETDDMALAGILSSQLLYEHVVTNVPTAEPAADRGDAKIVERRTVAGGMKV